MGYDTIEYEVCEPGIGVLTLNRPEKYNAVNQHMMMELEHFWSERENDTDTRVIILKGGGEKGFCAGLDMTEAMGELRHGMNSHQFYHAQTRMSNLMLKMRQAHQIIVCIVHGAAAGIGLSFALSSDVRVISREDRKSVV